MKTQKAGTMVDDLSKEEFDKLINLWAGQNYLEEGMFVEAYNCFKAADSKVHLAKLSEICLEKGYPRLAVNAAKAAGKKISKAKLVKSLKVQLENTKKLLADLKDLKK